MGRIQCDEEKHLCEHAEDVLHLANEIKRKEWHIKRLGGEKRELVNEVESLKQERDENNIKYNDLKEKYDSLKLLHESKADDVAITKTQYQYQQTTTRATLGKRPALTAPTDESSPKRPLGIGDHPTLAGDWHSEDVECKISERHWDPSCRGKICVIKKVSFPESSVWIKTSDSTVEVFNSMLEPVQPLKYDKVKVLHGDDVGQTGTVFELFSIDDADDVGYVYMDEDTRLKTCPVKFLGKINKN